MSTEKETSETRSQKEPLNKRDIVFAFLISPIVFLAIFIPAATTSGFKEDLIILPLAIVSFGIPVLMLIRVNPLFVVVLAFFVWFAQVRAIYGDRLTFTGIVLVVLSALILTFILHAFSRRLRKISTRLETTVWSAIVVAPIVLSVIAFIAIGVFTKIDPVETKKFFTKKPYEIVKVAFKSRDIKALKEYAPQAHPEDLGYIIDKHILNNRDAPWMDGVIVMLDAGANPLPAFFGLASYGRIQDLKAFLDYGVYPNMVGPGGQTALHNVQSISHVDLLVQYGADLSIKNADGMTPYDRAKEKSKERSPSQQNYKELAGHIKRLENSQ